MTGTGHASRRVGAVKRRRRPGLHRAKPPHATQNKGKGVMEKEKPEQVDCLVKAEGAGIRYMRVYDSLPPRVRKMLQDAPYNLCPACVETRLLQEKPDKAIDNMVKAIRYNSTRNLRP